MLSQLWEVAGEDADRERAEVVGLVDGYKEVFHLERFQFEIAWVVLVLVRPRIHAFNCLHGCPIYYASDTLDFDILQQAFSVEPLRKGQCNVDGIDGYIELGVVGVFFGFHFLFDTVLTVLVLVGYSSSGSSHLRL